MSAVFLGTVGLLARWDQTDQWHDAAELALRGLIARGHRTVSTTFVFAECGNAAARRPYRALVAQTREELERSGRLITPTQQDWEEAWTSYQRGSAGDAGIVEVTTRLGDVDGEFQQCGGSHIA